MANYLLKSYEPIAVEKVKKLGGTERMREQMLFLYEAAFSKFTDFDTYAIWAMIRIIMREEDYKLYDELREKYNATDAHIYTLFKNAFIVLHGAVPSVLIDRA